jgi:hypothetical protein
MAEYSDGQTLNNNSAPYNSAENKGKARDILARQSELEHERSFIEPVWEQVSQFCDPDGAAINWSSRVGRYSYGGQATRADEQLRKVYDSTISSASDRLAAGLESLITPQSEMWHGLSTAAMNDEETQEEKEWGESLRDFLFNDIRYQAGSNFVPAIQGVYLNVVRYGPAYLYSEEGFAESLIRYASIPVNEAYIARNRWGEPDVFHRVYERTARQCAETFGYENLPQNIRAMVDDAAQCLTKITLIQCVEPRKERRNYNISGEHVYLDSPFATYHVIEGEQVVVRERSFHTFPVSCFNWRRMEGDTYGVSPCIKALTTVREINAVRRTGLRALQQATDPPTASGGKLDDVPVLNPGTNYPGMIDDNGRILIQPINTGQRPDYAFNYAGNRSEEIKDMLYVNLFQILVQNPQMTATEALIRQEEKGSLLGPAGSIIQRGFATNLDRELSLLEEKGLYWPDSRFLPPESLAGKAIRPTFTSPLDVLRKAAEAKDTISLVSTGLQMAQVDPSVMDNFDLDEALRVVKGASRAPMRVLRKPDEVMQIREGRKQAQQAQQGMAALQGMAKTMKDVVPAAVQAKDQGLLPSTPIAGNA